jgi:hypothetical protein
MHIFFDRVLTARTTVAAPTYLEPVLMMHRDVADAAGAIDLRVDPFGTHLRTWDASVLVHFAAGDRDRGCGICDHPPALTQTFTLSHATLAVIDVLDG